MDSNNTIKVKIADRYYPIKIDRGDEDRFRTAERRVNDALDQYRRWYSDKDTTDFLAMVALHFASKLTLLESAPAGDALTDALEKLNAELDKAIGLPA